ncbi:MAG: PKD domain-containing protein [Bacteroidia bacterium]
MKSNFTNFYAKLSSFLVLFLGLSASSAFAQGFAGGRTYVVNGQTDQVAPVDTFVNLMNTTTGNLGALTYLNTNGIDVTLAPGTVTILLDAGYSGVEPSSIQVGQSNGSGYPNMSSTRPIVLKPNSGLNFVISTTATIAANGSLFRIFGSTDFTIDGSGTTGQRNITFNMGTSSVTSGKVIDFIPASANRIRNAGIRNCIIVGNSAGTTINTYAGIYFGGTASNVAPALVGTNYNINYTNNLIMAVQNGIYHRGFASSATLFPSQDTGINIINNIIGNYNNPINAANTPCIGGITTTPANGIYLNTVSNSTVSGNIIRNTVPLSVGNVNGGFSGIRLDGVNFTALDSNIRIVKNQIYGLYTNALSQGVSGIRVSLGTPTSPRRLLIANNSIGKIAAVSGGTSIGSMGTYTAGIIIDIASSNVGTEVLFNSVNLTGDTLATNSVSACFVTGPTTLGGITMMNNSYSNKLSRTTGDGITTFGNLLGYQNYAVIVSANNANPFSFSNFNNYHANTFGGGYAFVAGLNRGTNVLTNVSTLKSYVSYSPSDTNSFAVIPPVTSDTLWSVASGFSHRTYNRGYALTTLNQFSVGVYNALNNKVSDDIFGNPRTGLGRFTSIGCHQWLGDSIDINIALFGGATYNIEDINSYPPIASSPNTGSFKSLAEAITYLNSYGISGNQNNVTFRITSDYKRETVWIPAITDYPGSNPSLNVIIKPGVGVVDTIWAPNAPNLANSSVLRFMGAKNVILDGLTSTGPNVRNLTFMFRGQSTTNNARVIGIVPTDVPCQNITIRNINILGNTSTTAVNTHAGIYYGYPLTGAIPTANDTIRTIANNNINIYNNLIQGVRSGIVVRGSGANPAATAPDFKGTASGVPTFRIGNLNIVGNIIGGSTPINVGLPTTFIGGAADQAGIYVQGVEATLIDSNIIRNTIPTLALSAGFRGIEVAETSIKYPNFDVTVSKNFIYNIVTASGQSAIGIRSYFTAPTGARSYFFANNSISNIISVGGGAVNSATNPTGILIDAPPANILTSADLVTLSNNTINMSGNNFLGANNAISALFLNSSIRGGISSVNNIFGVTANRNTAGPMYSVISISPTSPFALNPVFSIPASDFNSYFVSGNNPTATNNILMATPSATPTTRMNINTIRQFTGTNTDLSSFNFPTKFLSDTLPNLNAITAGSRYTAGASVSLVLVDIYGAARSLGPQMGAVKLDLINTPLQPNATYYINGVDNYPVLASANVGSFKTLRSAVNYLNAFGVGLAFSGSNPVKLVINGAFVNGNAYVGETDTFTGPITVMDYPSATSTVPVIVTVAAGRQDTIKFTTVLTAPAAYSSLIRFNSSSYFGFDGSNNGTNSRDLTIVMPSNMTSPTYKIIDVLGGQSSIFATSLATSNNFVNNCNLIGNSTTSAINTFAAIYMGGITATPSNGAGLGGNNNNTFSNNFIGGCQYGIYLRGNGVRGQGDVTTSILNNVIGGSFAPGGLLPTNYFGGINNAAGIFCVGQYRANIKQNIIQNNMVNFSNPRGIELGVIVGSNTILDSANIIDGNIIKNISSTVNGSAAYGVYVNFGADAGNVTNSTRIINNMISGITATGSATLMNGVYGIAIDANPTNAFTDPNIGIHYNSISLGAANTVTAGRTACLAIADKFALNQTSLLLKSGFKMQNNLFSNKLGGTSALNGVRASAVQVSGLVSAFSVSENNNYFCNATNATNNHLTTNAIGTQNVFNGWDSINKFTGGDMYSTNFTVPFTSDLDLFIPALTNSVIYSAATPIIGINTDVISNTRNGLSPSMGAHEYTGGNNIDSVLPRIVPANSVVCLNATFNSISFLVVDKNYTGDYLTYRVNGGSSINLPSSATSSSLNSNGFLVRTYNFPASAFASGATIEYKITASDIVGNNGIYPNPAVKAWDTLSTGIATYPYTMNFEDGLKGWSTQSLTLGANWNTGAFGSSINPSQATENGIKCAVFPSATLAAGASARMVSPCFNLSVLQRPILRFRFSQSNSNVTKRDSVNVTVLINGFQGPIIKVAVRPNSLSPYPDWFTYEACLTEYRTPGNNYSFQFDAFSAGLGNNMLIDSIQILDDNQSQVSTGVIARICNLNQPVTITIPNTDIRYVYRAIELNAAGSGVGVLDSATGNLGALTLRFANRQVDTLNYVISAINYGSGTYQAPSSSVEPNYCSNNLPGTFSTVINRFTRTMNAAGGYIIPDILTAGVFNGAANDGDQFKPDAVKYNNSLRYEILTPTSFFTNASYGTNWTLLNTSVKSVYGNTAATSALFTAPTSTTNAKVTFTPTIAEADTLFVLTTTIRFLPTNCDTTVYRYIKVNNPIAYGFRTLPRTDTACTGTGLNFDINQGPKAGVTWLWSFGDNTNSTFANPVHIWNTAGTYRVTLRATSALGLSDTVSRLITVLSAPSAAYTASSTAIVCQNDSTYFTVSNQAAGLSYLWTFPGNVFRTAPVNTFGFSKADTNYSVTLKVTNSANACFAINNRIFPSYAKPKAKFNVTSHCQGQYMPYTDSSTISNEDRLGWYWTFSNGESRQSNSFQIKFVNSGNVLVRLRLISAAGCEDTTSRLVTVYETPKPDFLFTSACTNDSTTFNNQTTYGAGIQNAGYIWDFGDNSGVDTRQDPRHRYLNNNSGDPFIVKLIAYNKLFGCKDSAFKNVEVKTAPVAVAELGGTIKTGVSTDKVCQGNLVTFTSKSFASSGSEIGCGWVFGNGGQSGACNSSNIYPDAGVFNWSITATSDGCIDTKSGTITVVAKPVITFTKQSFSIPASRFTVNNRKVFTPSDLVSDGNQYVWNYGDADSSGTNQRIADFIYNKKGSFKVRMQVTTVDGCVVNYTDTANVDVSVSAGEELASKFNLSAYPNPFADNTVLGLSLTKTEDVTITITDILGRVISTTNHKNVGSGKHEFELASNNFTAAGTYIVKVQIGDEMVVKSLVKQ